MARVRCDAGFPASGTAVSVAESQLRARQSWPRDVPAGVLDDDLGAAALTNTRAFGAEVARLRSMPLRALEHPRTSEARLELHSIPEDRCRASGHVVSPRPADPDRSSGTAGIRLALLGRDPGPQGLAAELSHGSSARGSPPADTSGRVSSGCNAGTSRARAGARCRSTSGRSGRSVQPFLTRSRPQSRIQRASTRLSS